VDACTSALGLKKGLPAADHVPASHMREAALARKVLMVSGLDFANYRLAPLIRRVPACLRALRVGTPEAAAMLLADRPTLIPKALNALLIGTTRFFRDEAVFGYLEREVVPRIVENPTPPRVLSVACSDGAELYSMAMLLGAQEPGGYFLGIDCRADAIAAAGAGIFRLTAAAEIPADRLAENFTTGPNVLSVGPRLRALTHWHQSDIFREPPSGQWDVILCRNLAIYLDAQSTAKLWTRLVTALAPGGTLVVGKAEQIQHPALQRLAHCVYQKQPALTSNKKP
jgi:chemotaxis protein methyltransferase CheR